MICPQCRFEFSPEGHFCPRCGTKVEAPGDGGLSATRSIAPPEGRHQPGQLIGGRYKLLSAAGSGGMGIVFKAEDKKLRRTVALKFLPAEIGADPQAKMRFLREAQAAAVLDHPNICPVYEIDETGGEMFLTMAFIEGRSLKERIEEGPLPLIEVLNISVQVAEGLKAAHERGVVHRDIKPANIMLNREGQVRVADFGLASVEGGADLTRPQTVLGTAAYMSPEQIQGERADSRTDVWSFGCTLFEMATGRRPFTGEQGRTIANEILNDAPPHPASLRTDIPAGLAAVILKCLRKSAAERYPDFEGVLEALRGEGARRPASAAAQAPPPDALPALAVLPFVDMSAAKDQDYFGEGLAEELIHALARVQGLRIVARTSAFALKGMKLDVREIGKMLGVRAVLEGSVRKAGSRLRVTAQLIDALTGMHLWSERFDREERDVFDIQDEISLAIVERLKLMLLSGDGAGPRVSSYGSVEGLRRKPTTNTEAYNFYLKGLYFVSRPNREALESALAFFRQALELDPDFAQAHAGVALVFASMGAINLAPQNEVFPKAKAATERALALDPESALAHAISATVQYYFDLDWAAAEKSFRRVLELNPSESIARGQYAWLLVSLKKFDEAMTEIKRALAIDPLMPLLYAWSVGIHGAAGRTDEALEEFSRLKQIDPTVGLAYFHAAMAHYRRGEFARAIEVLEKGAMYVSFPGWGEDVLFLSRLRLGDRAGAEEIQARMVEARKTLPISAVTLAYGFAGLGDLDSAFEWLEQAVRDRDSILTVINVYTEFVLPELARDPRFGAFLDRLGLPH
jgi:TolB-like protein/Tfp pilus assembly protein PilF